MKKSNVSVVFVTIVITFILGLAAGRGNSNNNTSQAELAELAQMYAEAYARAERAEARLEALKPLEEAGWYDIEVNGLTLDGKPMTFYFNPGNPERVIWDEVGEVYPMDSYEEAINFLAGVSAGAVLLSQDPDMFREGFDNGREYRDIINL